MAPNIQFFFQEVGRTYLIKEYTLFIIKSGAGIFQIDFMNYVYFDRKVIYLSPGQYIKFLTNNFEITKVEIDLNDLFHYPDKNVLFEHLKSVAHLEINNDERKEFFDNSIFEKNCDEILNFSIKQWYLKNPFRASPNEYAILFELKDIIDRYYNKDVDMKTLGSMLSDSYNNVNRLVKRRLRLSIKKMFDNRRCLEAQRKIAFSCKNINEISLEVGFKYPQYFNRFFKLKTGKTPTVFRRDFGYVTKETFNEDILGLIKRHHKNRHLIRFYADRMQLSVKALSRKVKEKMDITIGQLVRAEMLSTAKHLLSTTDKPIREIASEIGFEESNNFSLFFRRTSGRTPTEYRLEKV